MIKFLTSRERTEKCWKAGILVTSGKEEMNGMDKKRGLRKRKITQETEGEKKGDEEKIHYATIHRKHKRTGS